MNSLHHHFSFQLLTLLVPSRSNPSLCTYRSHASSTSCSLRFHPSQKTKALKIPIEPLEFQSRNDESSKLENDRAEKNRSFQSETSNSEELHTKKEHEEEPDISGIHVPRERHILIPKKLLLEAILSIFDSQDEIDDFLRVSSCLDSILHAEHKDILEEMRLDYSVICTPELMGDATCSAKSEEKITPNGHHFPQDDSLGIERMERSGQVGNSHDTSVPFHYGLDLRFLLDSSARNVRKKPDGESRVAVATRFQCAFMKLLRDAQFEELSARDLQLTSALNTDYLLTLPIYVDWKRASESNAIIFRRGYAAECQKGLLIVEKLEYLQSRLLQRIFLVLSKPLKRFGMWINEAWDNIGQKEETRIWIERLRLWLKKWAWLERVHSSDDRGSHGQQGVKEQSDSDLPIRLVAQKAVPRYEDFLSSVGPRGRLLRKFLIWVGFIPSLPETSFVLDSGSAPSEPYLRPNFLSRISLSDIWKPATKKPCGDNVWKMFQTAISVLFSRSILQEPAFRELILLYNEEVDHIEVECNAELPLLQLKIYEKIPIPDLPVIFPHRRLSFRILDTVRLDVASILGLLAFFVNYKFEDILSSPSAFLLDVIASSALIIYVTRVALGYKQTWDRYQLLVNKTLYEKTLASGFGTVHFLLDASEQQQYKEAILTYAHLLRAEKGQVTCRKHTADMCERFMYDKFKEKVEMPIDQAINTLLRLGLVKEISLEGNCILLALPCSRAYEALKQQWDCLLG